MKEIKLNQINQILNIINNVNQIIIKEKNPKQLIQQICKLLVENGVNFAWIVLFDKNQDFISFAEYGLYEDSKKLKNLLKSGQLNECCKKSLKTSELIKIQNKKIECPICPLPKKENSTDISIRLIHQNRIFGTLCVCIPNKLIYMMDYLSLYNNIAATIGYALYNIELKESKLQVEINQSEILHKLNEAQRIAQIGSWDWDMITNEIWWSDETYLIFGNKPKKLTQNIIIDKKYIHPDDIKFYTNNIENCIINGADLNIEIRLILDNNQVKHCQICGQIYFKRKGEPIRFTGIILDITDRINADKKIKNSLLEKEQMLQEIHHRVKNNLQIINSLLNLQADRIKDPEIVKIFKVSQNRIHSMKLVHEKIYQNENLSSINFKDYITTLAYELYRMYHIDIDRYKLILDVEPVNLNLENAIPCGLILNDLISNSLTHAFIGREEGELKITMCHIDKEKIKLIVSDNGIGIPDNIDVRNSESLGLKLIYMLGEGQLKGKIKLNKNNGTSYEFTFKKKKPNKISQNL